MNQTIAQHNNKIESGTLGILIMIAMFYGIAIGLFICYQYQKYRQNHNNNNQNNQATETNLNNLDNNQQSV